MIKKVLSLVSKVCAIVFTFVFGVLTVGTAIANNHVDTVTTALGQTASSTVYVDTDDDEDSGDSTDSDYYKSAYSSVAAVRGAGIDYTQQVMEEGAVLLRNDNNALPLASGTKVSLFGVSSAKPTISGYREKGKGTDVVSFKDGLKYAGLEVNADLFDWYANSSYGKKSIYGNESFGNVYAIGEAPWSALPAAKTASGYKTAVFIISRIAGEATDVQVRDLGERVKGFDGKNGNYLILSNEEEDVLANLRDEKAKGTFDKIIVIMNVTNQVQCDFEDKYNVDALLYSGSIGSAGTKGIGNILAGKVNPSGKLSDTFWKNHYLNPVLTNWGPTSFNSSSGTGATAYGGFQYTNSGSFSSTWLQTHSPVATVYQESIYSGYRYTETRYEDTVLGRANVGEFNYNDVVAYPFGYGLSYTGFTYSELAVDYNSETDSYEVSVKVTNSGSTAGRNSVQLFLQKPYTEYDVTNTIEKAAVELVDFAKTDVLERGASETVNMSVARRDLACYDSYEKGSYILEAGDYYFAVGNDSHDALNNILANKAAGGKNVVAAKMVNERAQTVTGTSALAVKKTLDDSLFDAYSTSVMGKAIVNQFNNADLKLYDAVSSNTKNGFEYITRNNWAGTVKLAFDTDGSYANNYVKVELTDTMKSDMDKRVEKDTSVAMPTTGSKATSWKLFDLMNDENGDPIPYNDQKWEQLLDQLTWDEMEYLLSNGYSMTRAIESIAKPATYDQDSDLGVIGSYASYGKGLASRLADPDKSKYPAVYPDNGIAAATRNKELLYDYGVQWGEDCLWAGYSGLYGTGCNIHRSPYLGRSYGYYSEDPVLMGKAVAQINQGMESMGAFMLLKHCMLNEQETSRIGSTSWANEQTIREVYLRPFQIAIEEGGVQGVMTSLNRIGVVPAPHHSFLNEVLREEFGMVGYCVTDSYNSDFMNIANLLVAGNDLPLDQTGALADYKDYPNVVLAARKATHNILYTVVHSNAMNGQTSNSRIITFTPEWQYYLGIFNPIVLVLEILAVAFFVGVEVWIYLDKFLGKKKKDSSES